jgi:hypothetical protein
LEFFVDRKFEGLFNIFRLQEIGEVIDIYPDVDGWLSFDEDASEHTNIMGAGF